MKPSLMYFYPHRYLRDRQLDTIRNWPADEVINPEMTERTGNQVSCEAALSEEDRRGWSQCWPLLNLKRRPTSLAPDVTVYLWGAVVTSGPFIVDLDNPYALTGYNPLAMALYRLVLRRLLLSARCREIRCISEACRQSLKLLLGPEVSRRAQVYYPRVQTTISCLPPADSSECRFLFVATQFEIKGGVALLKAFRRLYESNPSVRLDLVTHLPPAYETLAATCPGITVHEAHFTREEIAERFLRHADVLVHPTYMESFGMVVLEALAYGLAVVATDVYAVSELVQQRVNGILLRPPISNWNGVLASRHFSDVQAFKRQVRLTDTSIFEEELLQAMREVSDRTLLGPYRRASFETFLARFSPKAQPMSMSAQL